MDDLIQTIPDFIRNFIILESITKITSGIALVIKHSVCARDWLEVLGDNHFPHPMPALFRGIAREWYF